MKLLFDFLPIIFFFLAYKFFDIYVATAVAIASTIAQVAVIWFNTRKLATMQLVTLAIIIVFGGLTLYLRDEQFIKWKPTVVNWLFAAAFIATQFFGKQTAIERMMGSALTLPRQIWRRLNLGWVVFFFSLGCANLYVMSHFDSDTWVNFKLFGMLGLTVIFIILQTLFLSRYLKEPNNK
ncbi:MAG: septation protein A [Proteobacteria bacterium]|nr:septation protein A [Pseudomonadota bacterium]